MSDGEHHCLIVIDAFLRFIQVYPLKSADATHTIEAMSIFISSFVIPQKLVYDRGTSFMSTNFFPSGIWHNLCSRNEMVALDQWESWITY